jgi:hypothetical protein
MTTTDSSGEKVSKEKIITIKKIDDEKLSIEADEGVINYTWKILDNINDLRVDFTISYKDSLMIFRENVSRDSSKINVNKDKEGEYIFEWLNKNDFNITISLKLTYEKNEIKEGTGCYSAIITFALILIAVIMWIIIIGYIRS